MICYTRNFEDVILQRVLADIDQGFFVDVGASMPIYDSNTYALYRKGWRGIAIEPLPYQSYWSQARPADIFINAAVSCQSGQMTLHVYDQAEQISSGSSETLAHWQRAGMQPNRSIDVPVLMLNQVIAEHFPGKPLHLISIDVEGMEDKVLKGLDLRAHRPWVLILEATLPGTPIPAHQKWEPDLLAAGYLFVYFDGANRFYLAQEHQHLLGRFSLPPNVWDDFTMVAQTELQGQVNLLKRQISGLQAEVARLNAKLI